MCFKIQTRLPYRRTRKEAAFICNGGQLKSALATAGMEAKPENASTAPAPMPMAAVVAAAVKAALEPGGDGKLPTAGVGAAVEAAVTAALEATASFQQPAPAPAPPVAAERGRSVAVLVPRSATAATASFEQPVPTPPVAAELEEKLDRRAGAAFFDGGDDHKWRIEKARSPCWQRRREGSHFPN